MLLSLNKVWLNAVLSHITGKSVDRLPHVELQQDYHVGYQYGCTLKQEAR
jgi:hypothetical protein